MTRPLRLGVQALTLDWAQWREAVDALETLPVSSLLFADHLLEAFADPLAGAAAVAGRGSRLRVGTMMLNAANRHPAVVAKGAATLAALSEQPVELGIGAGWLAAEADAAGLPLGDPPARVDRFEESLEILRGLLSQPRTTVHGEHYRVDAAEPALPLPLERRPLLMVGAGRPRMLRLAARHADIVGLFAGGGWSSFALEDWAMAATPAKLAATARTVREAAESAGRDPEAIELSGNPLAVAIADTFAEAARHVPDELRVSERAMRASSSYLVGTAAEVQAKLAECREGAGVTYLVCTFPQLDLAAAERMRTFCEAVVDPPTARVEHR